MLIVARAFTVALLFSAELGCGAPEAGGIASSRSAKATATADASAGLARAIASTPEAAPPPSAAPPVTASDAVPPPALSGFAALSARFPPREAWPHGPGVFCGEKVCAAGEACCNEAPTPRCVPADTPGECSALLRCDESSDCAASLYCCLGRVDNDAFKSECVTRARCDHHWDRPGGYGLPAQEICGRGGSCKTSAHTCVPQDDSIVSGGQCVSSAARTSCGTAGECPAERPWCFWDEERTTSECIPRGPWLGEDGVFECDSRGDCPGGTCCGYSDKTRCCPLATVDKELAYANEVCKTNRDCSSPGDVCHPYTKEPPHQLAPGLGACGPR